MRLTRNTLAAAFAIAACCSAFSTRAADPALAFAPEDSEVVASVNLRAAVDSKLGQMAIKQFAGDKRAAQLDVVKNLTGLDPLKDLDRVYLWARVNDDDSVGLAVEGRFDKEKLASLIKTSDDYMTTEVKGRTVHQWYDKKEKKTKYGLFLTDTLVAQFNSIGAVERSLDANESGKGLAAGPVGKLIPVGSDKAAAWGVLVKTDRVKGFPKKAAKIPAGSATGMVTMTDEAVDVELALKADPPVTAADWLDVVKGVLAIGKLQQENAAAQKIAGSAKAEMDAATGTVKLRVEIPNDDIKALAHKKGKASR